MTARGRRAWLPVLALLLGATLWGTMWWPLRHFEGAGLAGAWLALAMYAVAVTVALPWAWRARGDWRTHWRIVVLLMLLGGWTNVAFTLAMLEGQVLRVLLLFYLAPVWSVLGARLFLGEAVTWRRGLGVLVALLGAALVLAPERLADLADAPLTRADWLALSSGICFAGTNITLRAGQGLADASRAWAVWLGCTLIAGLILAGQGAALPDLPLSVFLQLFLFAVSWLIVATLVVQYGVTRMEVGRSALILLFEIVAGAVSAAWLAGETVSSREWLGGLLIVGAAVLEARRAEDSSRD